MSDFSLIHPHLATYLSWAISWSLVDRSSKNSRAHHGDEKSHSDLGEVHVDATDKLEVKEFEKRGLKRYREKKLNWLKLKLKRRRRRKRVRRRSSSSSRRTNEKKRRKGIGKESKSSAYKILYFPARVI